MPGTGVNRYTGQPLTGFDHTIQSLEVLFATPIGPRVLHRTFGSMIPPLLGRNIVPSTLLRYVTAVHTAIALWEPRLAVKQVTFPKNTPEGMRAGRLGLAILAEYRPRGHLGDPTPEGVPKWFTL